MFSNSIPKDQAFRLLNKLTATEESAADLLKVAAKNDLLGINEAAALEQCDLTTKLAALAQLVKQAAPAKPMKAAPSPVPRSAGPSAPPPGVAAPKPAEPPVAGISGAPITKTAVLGAFVPKALGLGAVSAGAYWGGKNARETAMQAANENSPTYSRVNAEQTAGRLGMIGGGLLGAGVAYGLGRPAMANRVKSFLAKGKATDAQQDGLHLVGSALAGMGSSMVGGHFLGKAVANHKAEKLKDRMNEPPIPTMMQSQVKTAGLFVRPSELSDSNQGLAAALEGNINGSGQSKGFTKKAGVVDIVRGIAGNEHVIPTVAGAAIGAALPLAKTTFGSPPKATPEPEDPENTFMGKTLAATSQYNQTMERVMFEHPAQSALAGAVLGGVVGFKSTDATEAVKGLINRLRGTTGV